MSDSPAARAGVRPDHAAGWSDALVDLLAGGTTAASVHEHRRLHDGPLRPGLGALVAPVSRLGGVLDALDSDGGSGEPLPLVLLADTGLVEAAEARAVLLDDDRLVLEGLQVALPPDGPLDAACRMVLDSLDFALPTSVAVPLVPGWESALDVLAEDGAERALLATGPRPVEPGDVAAFVVAASHRGVGFCLTGSAYDGRAAVAALAATAAALDGREVSHVAALLAEDDADVLLAVLADADPLVVRRRLPRLGSTDARGALESLELLGLLEAEAE